MTYNQEELPHIEGADLAIIFTKRMPSGEYSCGGMIGNIDVCFVGPDISVVAGMHEYLKKHKVNAIWGTPEIHNLNHSAWPKSFTGYYPAHHG